MSLAAAVIAAIGLLAALLLPLLWLLPVAVAVVLALIAIAEPTDPQPEYEGRHRK